jgi:hypothetical protein
MTTVLEQALEHLLNKEEAKASDLLHDYYVGIGRKVYEDIMSDDTNLEEEIADIDAAVDEVEADLTEEGDDELDLDSEIDPDIDAEEIGDEMGAEEAPVSADAADVADAMVDVESALANLKAEFEEMLTGGADEEIPGDDIVTDEIPMDAEEIPAESVQFEDKDESIDEADSEEKIDEAAELKLAQKPDLADHADNKASPVAKKNDMGGKVVNTGSGAAEGVASGTAPAKAPASQELPHGTTEPSMSQVKG